MDIPTYISDLCELTNIIDSLVITPQDVIDTFTAEDQVDMIGTVMQLMYDYVLENPEYIQNPTFHNDMMESVEELLRITTQDGPSSDDIDEVDELTDIVNHAIELFYVQVMPKRSIDVSESKNKLWNSPRTHRIRQTLTRLQSIPQPVQRTSEWYEYRHSLITASNAYKIFDSHSAQNQLIFEKCSPLPVLTETSPVSSSSDDCIIHNTPVPTVNVTTPMHWGQKYEPLSTMYYEMIHNTTVGEFGCIRHSNHSFLGASPDGIVDDPSSDKYGQMLEIKNIVNRDITGIPLKAYWVQMQLQLEVCDLDECDFLETRFKEYDDKDAFINDCNDNKEFTKTCSGKWKGVLLYFIDKNGIPIYEYKPIQMDKEEYENMWEPEVMRNHNSQGHVFMWASYWWLEEVSCVVVERNRLWFSLIIDKINTFWNTILEERETGYSHRAPVKRKPKDDGFNQCMITIDGTLIESNTDTKVSIDNSPKQNTIDSYLTSQTNNIVHIRTRSFDETKQSETNNITHIRTRSFDETKKSESEMK